jgi:ribonuclease HII
MRQLHEQYPVYGLDRHKGYATKEHLDAVAAHGYSAIHRKSFHRQRHLMFDEGEQAHEGPALMGPPGDGDL